MSTTFDQKYERDRGMWDGCAAAYEKRIVTGHPDVLAYEHFEEDLLERILRHLIRDCHKTIHLFDMGCGSGRLHLRLGVKMTRTGMLDERDAGLVAAIREKRPEYGYCPELDSGILDIGGIDFSTEMISLARRKLAEAGLTSLLDSRLNFAVGSAFSVGSYDGAALPVAVNVCNSIGVMQGPSGAAKLFEAMRRYVEPRGGIAIISAYRQEAMAGFGLSSYESTLDVSGQPCWLVPDTFASEEFVQIARRYKYHHDPDPGLLVDVYDRGGSCVKAEHVLRRDPILTKKTIEEGRFSTYQGYTSHWYSWVQMETWIQQQWAGLPSMHILAGELDSLRAAPAQLCILDCQGLLGGLLKSFGAAEAMPESVDGPLELVRADSLDLTADEMVPR